MELRCKLGHSDAIERTLSSGGRGLAAGLSAWRQEESGGDQRTCLEYSIERGAPGISREPAEPAGDCVV